MKALISAACVMVPFLLSLWMQRCRDKKTKKQDERPQIHGDTVVRPVTKGPTASYEQKRIMCRYCGTVNEIIEGIDDRRTCRFCGKIIL